MDFDHRRAWTELAEPAFNALPLNLRELFVRVAEECAGLSQDADCLLLWPSEATQAEYEEKVDRQVDPLRVAFDDIPWEILAPAAHTIYSYGHWSPEPSISRLGAGAYWRFSNYADQVLRRKCVLGDPVKRGVHYEIHQGFLRVCLSTPRCWMWEEIGTGTPETLKQAQTYLPRFEALKADRNDKLEADFEEIVPKMKEALVPNGSVGRWFDLKEFMS